MKALFFMILFQFTLFSNEAHDKSEILDQCLQECSSVTEIGLSSQGLVKTILSHLSKKKGFFLGIDPRKEFLDEGDTIAHACGVPALFWQVEDSCITLEPTEMLVLDYKASYKHITYELESFERNVSKYLVVHGLEKEEDESSIVYPLSFERKRIDCSKKGVSNAVFDFVARHPAWVVLEKSEKGFCVLKREKDFPKKEEMSPQVDYFLKNKIVLCTGPSLHQKDLLKNCTEADMALIPFKKIFVTTNDPSIMGIRFKGQEVVCELIPEQDHQLDCINALLLGFKNAVNDKDVQDDDILLFKHETVFINDMHLIKKAIGKILQGHDMVVRTMMCFKGHPKTTDAVFARAGAIREIVKKATLVKSFQDASYCEEYFSYYVCDLLSKVYAVPMYHSCWGFSELGFYHIPKVLPCPQGFFWDMKNYEELYK